MRLRVLSTDRRVLNMRLRMPFRFGITTVSALPHLFVRVLLEIDGRRVRGNAADHLPNKWLTKDPATSLADDVSDMLKVITAACDIAVAGGRHESVYELWERMYLAHAAWAGGWGYPPLLAAFGPSLVERAILDAFCRDQAITFPTALRENRLGIRLGRIHDELSGAEPADLLPASPLREIVVRHTVGLLDPITDADIPPGERLRDGLPQSLEAAIHAYGLTHFKVKLWGDLPRDRERLRQVGSVLRRLCGNRVGLTLDGNENFKSAEEYRAFWSEVSADPNLAGLLAGLLFVEQPIHRDSALGSETRQVFARWPDRPPTIIDESDATLASLPQALDIGYAGTSHKNCKGVIKGIANACLLEHRRRSAAASRFILSAEDLSNVAPVALLEDLSVIANLGISHTERNGHHYFRGLSHLPADLQEMLLASHGDLFRRHADGFVTPRIEAGAMRVGSVVDHGMGLAFDFDPSRFTPVGDWTYASLELD